MSWFILSLISAIFSAASAIMQKRVLQKLDAINFCFYLSLINILFTIPFAMKAPWPSLTLPIASLIMLKSFLNALGFLSVMRGLKTLDITRGLPLLALTPVVVGIFGVIFLDEQLSLLELAALALVVLGTLLLEKNEVRPKFEFTKGHGVILIALFLMSANTILDRLIVGPLKIAPPLMLTLTNVGFVLFFTLIWLIKQKDKMVAKAEIREHLIWLLLIGVATLTYRLTNLMALSLAGAAVVITVKRSSVIFATMIGGKLFAEGNYKKRVLAVALIVAGTMMLFKFAG